MPDVNNPHQVAEALRAWASMVSSGYVVPAAGQVMLEAAHILEGIKSLDPATSPGMTDLMVPPETLDAFMEANPLPPEPANAVEIVRAIRASTYRNEDGTPAQAALNILAGSEDGNEEFKRQTWFTREVLAHLGISDTSKEGTFMAGLLAGVCLMTGRYDEYAELRDAYLAGTSDTSKEGQS